MPLNLDWIFPQEPPSPFDLRLAEQRKEIVAQILLDLTAKQRKVLTLYYSESLPFLEIGKRMRVSESAACQLHTRALEKIRAKTAALGIRARDIL